MIPRLDIMAELKKQVERIYPYEPKMCHEKKIVVDQLRKLRFMRLSKEFSTLSEDEQIKRITDAYPKA